ncbi:YajG family lipoprotein [Microbulbifer thermotolerans]|uniref:YajG family lipoprotein n=1 Tax=Microbulbifer thermotolerans TaxID=252514 RepID=A0AB35I1K2_MICTH|nr:YajG family lipoprotein [Microbulbifer thermotolerans]MCX2778400.1 YajG family lipoprotein [Microbulbifer thermotolerans]MCX2784182.1 YajG family lipoprotein [Microbulbifer thermotolerans]MCX2796169.1 YajG family lipoprotein [Microbulbifer thermotolerans]MCX2803036.1 YajG family lipoprotein [Microbulbifer thermotolerans]MCX2804439.1 YajG family lipoprotein [Microbulbifer thermotolerans]
MKKLLLLLGACVLAACAHSPLQIQVHPQVQVVPETIGAGYTLSVRGVNQLPGGGLGSLGGVYAETARVSLANDVEGAIASTLRGGFDKWAFRTVDEGGDVQVLAKLTGLKYDSPNKLYTSKVDTSAEVELEVKIGGATYFGSYRSSGVDRTLIKPSREEVEARINGLLGATLQRAFEDEKLKNFLRTHL